MQIEGRMFDFQVGEKHNMKNNKDWMLKNKVYF